jgi:hypothetical protein
VKRYADWLIIPALILGGWLGWSVIPSALAAAEEVKNPRPRFEKLYNEGKFNVWHDRETGQEIVCVEQYGSRDPSNSCWITGRKW